VLLLTCQHPIQGAIRVCTPLTGRAMSGADPAGSGKPTGQQSCRAVDDAADFAGQARGH
jgi:hypothetical protein